MPRYCVPKGCDECPTETWTPEGTVIQKHHDDSSISRTAFAEFVRHSHHAAMVRGFMETSLHYHPKAYELRNN